MVWGKRILSFAVIGSLCATAALAITILLFSEFDRTQGRILGTTALIALYGLLALPAGILFDQARLVRLARTVLVLTVAGFALALTGIWTNNPSEELGKAFATVTAFALAATQTAALAARRNERDPQTVRRLYVASLTLAVVAASMATVAAWAEIGNGLYFRVLAALVVADVLTVVLQPILARTAARRAPTVHRLRLLFEPGGEHEVEVKALSFAAAVGQAVATAEQKGARVQRIERVGTPEDVAVPRAAVRTPAGE